MYQVPATALPSALADVPQQLFGYDVIDFIGEGAGSRIYAVTHPETRQLYALKHVTRREERDIRFVHQLEQEYAVARDVRDPRLRRAFDLKIEKTILRKITEAALVLELFDGAPLDMQVPNRVSGIVSCFVEVSGALDALHGHGFVHCDLKPNNILVNHDGGVKIIDLGQAVPIGTAKERIQGTPDYIAPEQVKRRPVTPQTDVFNLGATMYWTLCGRKIPTLYNIERGRNSFVLDDSIVPPHVVNPDVPEPLSNFVLECVRTNPSKRPEDMREVKRRLEIIHHVMTRPARACAVAS